jgi:hypothetical protein
MRVAVMAALNMPVLLLLMVLSATWLGQWAEQRRKQAGLERGRCERKVPTLPGKTCGMPLVACVELYEGDAYHFFQWVCDEHARDASRRVKGSLVRVDWLGE